MIMTIFRLLLLVGLIVCAAATALVKKPMQAVIIYMAYSVIMSVVWIMLESPDLAITEAAVRLVLIDQVQPPQRQKQQQTGNAGAHRRLGDGQIR